MTEYELIQNILSNSDGKSAREILRSIKAINQLGLSHNNDSAKWVKRDVNRVLYKMLKEGLVENEIRDVARPYWKLTNQCMPEVSHLNKELLSEIQSSLDETIAIANKVIDDLENKVKSVFDEFGAIYIDEVDKLIELDISTLNLHSFFSKYRKFILEPKNNVVSFNKWSKDDAIDAIKIASTYYFPLSGPNYQSLIDMGEIEGPGIQRIYKQFDWSELCKEAGVEFKAAPRGDYSRTWSEEELLNFVIRFLQSTIESDSYHMYSEWRAEQNDHVPNIQTITNYLGAWSFVRNKALESIRISKGKELRE